MLCQVRVGGGRGSELQPTVYYYLPCLPATPLRALQTNLPAAPFLPGPQGSGGRICLFFWSVGRKGKCIMPAPANSGMGKERREDGAYSSVFSMCLEMTTHHYSVVHFLWSVTMVSTYQQTILLLCLVLPSSKLPAPEGEHGP